MESIHLGSIQLLIQAATKTFAILAKRGAGKSYTAAVLAEEFCKNNIRLRSFHKDVPAGCPARACCKKYEASALKVPQHRLCTRGSTFGRRRAGASSYIW
jgi:hypothetical protein